MARSCVDCGKQLSRNPNAKRCRSCHNRNRYKGLPMPSFQVDDKYREAVMRHRWRRHTHGYIAGRPFGREDSGWLLHQFVWFLETGERVPNLDHINGDKTDCRLDNLRLATNSLQSLNQKQRNTRLKLPTGVVYGPSKVSPYQAYIKYRGKRRYLGSFKTAELASQKYQETKQRLIEYEAAHAQAG